MQITLSPESEQFVREQLAKGAYKSEVEVIEDGLLHLRLSDPLAAYSREELNQLIDEGLKDIEEGRTVVLDDAEIARIKADGRKRLALARRGAE